MNRRASEIIIQFVSQNNIRYLYDESNKLSISNDQFYSILDNFVQTISAEIMVSDPLPNITTRDQVNCYNRNFLNYMFNLVDSDNIPNEYQVFDNMPTTRYGRTYQGSANDLLKHWEFNTGKPVQIRQDKQGEPTTNQRNYYMSGITFCDQSDVGMNTHTDRYENTPYKNALNKQISTPFGVSTIDSDRRLLERRSFRSNERGVENGIPLYETRLYNRPHEKDIGETLANTEYDYQQQKWDMSSINCRIEQRNSTKNKYRYA
jgi:hypothetical protein